MSLGPNVSAGDLSPHNLELYLHDPTFIEYLNSFLLLPAFSNKLFYNIETKYFELVHDEGLMGCVEDELKPSSSSTTLYLPDESIGPSLNREQSWDWIIQNRLPLFLRSDLYSEYKMCKHLSSYIANKVSEKDSSGWKVFQSQQHDSVMDLSNLTIHELDHEDQELTDSQIFPDIKRRNSEADLGQESHPSYQQQLLELPNSQILANINRSSEVEEHYQTSMMQRSHSFAAIQPSFPKKPEKSPRKSMRRKSSSSKSKEECDSAQSNMRKKRLELMSKIRQHSFSESLDSAMDVLDESTGPDVVGILSKKSGMTAFWKFLKGKAGEANWLFWLDAERVKYYEGKEQTRMLRDLHEKYFLESGDSLELPLEIRRGVSRSVHMTMKQVYEIQQVMAAGLADYWCPRFLLHYQSEQENSLTQSMATQPNVFRPYSASSPIPRTPGDSRMDQYSSPQVPSHTPTFKRIHVKTSLSDPSHSARLNQVNGTASGLGSPVIGGNSRNSSIGNLSPSPMTKRRSLKSIGDVKSDEDSDKLPSIKESSRQESTSASRYSQLARYSARHLPDPNSQCASRMEGNDRDSICKSHCTILSISGTPTHLSRSPDFQWRSSTTEVNKETYKSLFHCLSVENRKAGGYFMKYLKNQDKVYINALLFWRDVQEYKALFVGKKFNPCSVEMKSKVLFGKYVNEGSSNGISCSRDVRDLIMFNLKPAYEDLFDLAEEHAVELLVTQWTALRSQDNDSIQQVERIPVSCTSVQSTASKASLETVSDKVIDFDRSVSPISVHVPRPLSSMADRGPFRRRHAIVSISPAMTTAATSLNDIISNPVELEFFKIFLNEKLAAQDLMCWMDIENYRGIPSSSEVIRNMKAKKIRKDHLNKSYYFGANSPATKEIQRMTMQAGGGNYGARMPARPSTPVLREVQKHVRARLEKKWLAEFMMSPEYVERNRQTRLSGSWDRRMSMKFNQLNIENSFMHSHEALQFRKFLNQKKTANFERFLKARSQSGHSATVVYHPRENIEFWCEVQRYKVMCHAHTRGSILNHKVRAIVDCFFCSPSPPELQIDVPLYIVEQIRKRDHGGGPYLFREAQAAVFSSLYNGWKEYQTFIAGLPEGEIKKAVDMMKKEIAQAQKQKREKEESDRLEEETKKMRVPRFETAEEREMRVRNEREMAEFGPVAVEFRLSAPDPRSYNYFTDLPDKFYATDSDPTLSRSAVSQCSLVSHRSGFAPQPKPVADVGDGSVTLMKLEGGKPIPRHIKDRLKKPKVEVPRISSKEISSRKSTVQLVADDPDGNKGSCNESVMSGTSTEDRAIRRIRHRGKGRLLKRSLSSAFPKVTIRTISMRMSNIDKGEAYAYGSGIIEEQSSFLEVTSKS